MKKNYLMGLATLAMIMASCSQNEVLNSERNGESNVIGFSTYTGKTKAAVTDVNGLKTGGFGVAAFLTKDGTTTRYMGAANEGAQISYQSTKWNYAKSEDVRYWPATGTLNFYAYAPFANTNRTVAPTYSITDGMKFTDYVVPTDFAKQEDFMYASNLTATSASGAVTLAFNHALTQVLFSVVTIGGLKVDIEANGIEIHNVMPKGTFELTAASPAVASWHPSTTNTDKTTYKLTSSAVTDIATTATKIGTSLMLMPQTLAAWSTGASIAINDGTGGAKNTYLKINCKIYDAANNYILGTSSTYGTTYVPFGGFTWAMNQKITYKLSFGGGFDDKGNPILKPITFTPSVEAWGTETTTELPLD